MLTVKEEHAGEYNKHPVPANPSMNHAGRKYVPGVHVNFFITMANIFRSF